MQKHLSILSIVVIMTATGFSQTIPADYQHPEVKEKQRKSTDFFLKLLEQGKIDDALTFIDSSFLKSKHNYKDSLTAYSKELSKYLKTTKLYVIVVYPDDRYNTFSCRYSNNKGDFFSIDLYYVFGQLNSSITKILKVPEKELENDRKELAKQKKEEKKSGPPPPPPRKNE